MNERLGQLIGLVFEPAAATGTDEDRAHVVQFYRPWPRASTKMTG
jgi:hypothetical protein